MGFPIAIALVVILGVVLVAWARTQRESEDPTLRDHWHSAYGVWVCSDDQFLEPFLSENDPDGIHSHQDGLIHIHPFGSSVTGDDAQMDVFLSAMNVSLDDDQMILADGTVLAAADTECDGEAAIWQVARWGSALDIGGPPDEIITEDLAAIRFEADGEAFTIALAPEGADIPPPPTAAEVAEASESLLSEGPVTDLGDDTGGVDLEGDPLDGDLDLEGDPLDVETPTTTTADSPE